MSLIEVHDALFLTAKNGRDDDLLELCQQARQDGINLDPASFVDSLGCSPLHYAASANHVAAVEVLVREWAIPINARNNLGETALHKVRTSFSLSFLPSSVLVVVVAC